MLPDVMKTEFRVYRSSELAKIPVPGDFGTCVVMGRYLFVHPSLIHRFGEFQMKIEGISVLEFISHLSFPATIVASMHWSIEEVLNATHKLHKSINYIPSEPIRRATGALPPEGYESPQEVVWPPSEEETEEESF